MTLDELAGEFSRSEARVRGLILNHNPETLNTRPSAGRWSALQCIEHLALTNELNIRPLRNALRRPGLPIASVEVIQPGLIWSLLLRAVDPRTRLRGFAPPRLRPADCLDPAVTHRRFLATHAAIRDLMHEYRGLDINRIRFPHPVIRLRISAASTLWLLALHEDRHLLQAERAAG